MSRCSNAQNTGISTRFTTCASSIAAPSRSPEHTVPAGNWWWGEAVWQLRQRIIAIEFRNIQEHSWTISDIFTILYVWTLEEYAEYAIAFFLVGKLRQTWAWPRNADISIDTTSESCKAIHTQAIAGWWLGTFFIFPYIGNKHPNWLIFFRRGGNHQPDTYWWIIDMNHNVSLPVSVLKLLSESH